MITKKIFKRRFSKSMSTPCADALPPPRYSHIHTKTHVQSLPVSKDKENLPEVSPIWGNRHLHSSYPSSSPLPSVTSMDFKYGTRILCQNFERVGPFK